VVEDLYQACSEVHFDALLQLGQRSAKEVIVNQECDFTRHLVELDNIGLVDVSLKH
jgi:hypothetical protein